MTGAGSSASAPGASAAGSFGSTGSSGSAGSSGSSPSAGLFDRVSGQAAAINALRAAARRPVHAYLFVGPPGTGRLAAAEDFAAALLAGEPDGAPAEQSGGAPAEQSDGAPAEQSGGAPADLEDVLRRVRAGTHPDVTVVEREGASISIGMARDISKLAARSPQEGERRVLVLTDFHLVKDAGPALLKTIEEPPPTVVFVIVADYVPPELVTIASRCVRVDFRALTTAEVVTALESEGVDKSQAEQLAAAAGGRLDRARLLASDPEFERRRQAWMAVPGNLDGHGATAARLADELVSLLDSSVAPMQQRHEEDRAALEERNARALEINGKVGRGTAGLKAGVKDLEDRQKREVRRQRTDELRAGLAALAGVYRDRLTSSAGAGAGAGSSGRERGTGPSGRERGTGPSGRERGSQRVGDEVVAVEMIQIYADRLQFNIGETLALQALFARLGRLQVSG